MKKRILLLLMAAVVSLGCVGCTKDIPTESVHEFAAEDFVMRIDNPYVTPHSTELFYTMTVLNDVPDAEITYGEAFVIEKQNEDGSWTRALPADKETPFTLTAYHIYGHSVCESIPINSDLYGSLSVGHYRLLKYINGNIPVSAEFDVIPSDIRFELYDAENVTTETPMLKYSFIYQGDGTREYMCGIEFKLEKRDENGKWQYVQPKFFFTQIGYTLSQKYPEFDLGFLPIAGDSYTEPLTAGEYRVSAELFNDNELVPQPRKNRFLRERFYAEFTIN